MNPEIIAAALGVVLGAGSLHLSALRENRALRDEVRMLDKLVHEQMVTIAEQRLDIEQNVHQIERLSVVVDEIT